MNLHSGRVLVTFFATFENVEHKNSFFFLLIYRTTKLRITFFFFIYFNYTDQLKFEVNRMINVLSTNQAQW